MPLDNDMRTTFYGASEGGVSKTAFEAFRKVVLRLTAGLVLTISGAQVNTGAALAKHGDMRSPDQATSAVSQTSKSGDMSAGSVTGASRLFALRRSQRGALSLETLDAPENHVMVQAIMMHWLKVEGGKTGVEVSVPISLEGNRRSGEIVRLKLICLDPAPNTRQSCLPFSIQFNEPPESFRGDRNRNTGERRRLESAVSILDLPVRSHARENFELHQPLSHLEIIPDHRIEKSDRANSYGTTIAHRLMDGLLRFIPSANYQNLYRQMGWHEAPPPASTERVLEPK